MAHAEFIEKIEKARKFVEFHPESGGLLETMEELAGELAAAEDYIASIKGGKVPAPHGDVVAVPACVGS